MWTSNQRVIGWTPVWSYLACITGALWAKQGKCGIWCEVQDRGERKNNKSLKLFSFSLHLVLYAKCLTWFLKHLLMQAKSTQIFSYKPHVSLTEKISFSLIFFSPGLKFTIRIFCHVWTSTCMGRLLKTVGRVGLGVTGVSPYVPKLEDTT